VTALVSQQPKDYLYGSFVLIYSPTLTQSPSLRGDRPIAPLVFNSPPRYFYGVFYLSQVSSLLPSCLAFFPPFDDLDSRACCHFPVPFPRMLSVDQLKVIESRPPYNLVLRMVPHFSLLAFWATIIEQYPPPRSKHARLNLFSGSPQESPIELLPSLTMDQRLVVAARPFSQSQF